MIAVFYLGPIGSLYKKILGRNKNILGKKHINVKIPGVA